MVVEFNSLLFLFLKGMTGALAPFSYLINKQLNWQKSFLW